MSKSITGNVATLLQGQVRVSYKLFMWNDTVLDVTAVQYKNETLDVSYFAQRYGTDLVAFVRRDGDTRPLLIDYCECCWTKHYVEQDEWVDGHDDTLPCSCYMG